MGKLVRFRYRTNSEVVKLLRDYRNKELNVIPTNGYELCILSDEAVECEGLIDVKYNVDEQLNKFIEVGGEILACGTCLKSRQLESTEACPISTMIDCVEVVEWADKMVTF